MTGDVSHADGLQLAHPGLQEDGRIGADSDLTFTLKFAEYVLIDKEFHKRFIFTIYDKDGQIVVQDGTEDTGAPFATITTLDLTKLVAPVHTATMPTDCHRKREVFFNAEFIFQKPICARRADGMRAGVGGAG